MENMMGYRLVSRVKHGARARVAQSLTDPGGRRQRASTPDGIH